MAFKVLEKEKGDSIPATVRSDFPKVDESTFLAFIGHKSIFSAGLPYIVLFKNEIVVSTLSYKQVYKVLNINCLIIKKDKNENGIYIYKYFFIYNNEEVGLILNFEFYVEKGFKLLVQMIEKYYSFDIHIIDVEQENIKLQKIFEEQEKAKKEEELRKKKELESKLLSMSLEELKEYKKQQELEEQRQNMIKEIILQADDSERTKVENTIKDMTIEELKAYKKEHAEQVEKEKLIKELLGENDDTDKEIKDTIRNVSSFKTDTRPASRSISQTAQKESYTSPALFNKNVKRCPKCKSTNIELIDGDVKDYKKTTSLNVNPLKPLTVFNHNTKEKKKKVRSKGKVAAATYRSAPLLVTGGTKTVVHRKFVCLDHYHVWYEK